MKPYARRLLLFSFYLLPHLLSAQPIADPPVPDEGMDMFLLVFGSLFVAAMFGAAMIGAFLAALVVLLFLTLFSFGLLSTSFFVGLYHRSFRSGLKTFLLLLFCTTCPFAGWILFSFFNKLFPLPLTSSQVSFIGLGSGLVGGLLLALMTFRILQKILHMVGKRIAKERCTVESRSAL